MEKKYKKRYDPKDPDGLPYQILESTMLFVGKMSWVIKERFKTPQERNEALSQLG
ncbi:peptidyl-prolyl cis-trans isomerase B [Vibrio phage VAP7]|uniref:Peptidyl-prolyl cis-trans isomerase B n=1 Tax=Vibrio phage VAP7 TaxID=2584487 RepID=A0A4Y5TV74_9CAUD|nr:peptidyl-prolyl cis-trans isomerase B [Vibrio phage VAP7]QDB73261.1 peptidyl-prolyl cis-trans isomerase B [Vibrio phage VAP7]UFD98054.1 hypothetical protein [Vibrio phage BX-1]